MCPIMCSLVSYIIVREEGREEGREGGNGREYTFICMIMGVYVCCMYVHAPITSIACIV